MEQGGFDIYIVLCFGYKNVLNLMKFALRNGRVRQHGRQWHSDSTRTQETFENVEDGVARGTTPVDVECCFVTFDFNLATTA